MAAGPVVAVIVAAGRGERLGQDKATMQLGAESAVARVVRHCREAECVDVVIVRRDTAPTLPTTIAAHVVSVATAAMIDSVRAGLRAVEALRPAAIVLFPIDHAMVGADVVAALVASIRAAEDAARIALPICRGRPGHPIAMTWAVATEVLDPATTTLRDVIRRDRARIDGVPVEDGWVLRDIDHPADLRAARGALAQRVAAPELMARHRSRRRYAADPVGEAQLRWLVDSARCASTSSFIQAATAVVVTESARKARIARLCADQAHVHEAPVFVAVCADLHRLAAACARRGKHLETDSVEIFLQATIDAALFGQNLQLAAESEGLGACMIGAARDHAVELARELALPPHVWVPFGMTLGWPIDDPVPRERLDLDAVLHFEQYRQDDLDAVLDHADDAMRRWATAENARAAGTGRRPIDATRGWTDRMAWSFGSGLPPKGRARLLEELRTLGFGLRPGPEDP